MNARIRETPTADPMAVALPDAFEVTAPDGSAWLATRYINQYMRSAVFFILTPVDPEDQ